MREGNGEATLCLFPERITPNHHKLAREFVLLDNFYVDGEVSADGHEWTMAAYASDYVEKFWPLNYGHNKSGKFSYPSEGHFPIATPAGGYLWDRAAEAGITFRSYGEFVQNGKTPADPATTRLKALQNHFDAGFRSFDMDYPDVKRAERFISELRRFEAEGDMPRLQVVRLPQDHTSGTTPGKWTPTACMADNDLALGMVVEAVSKSKFWSSTAIFVVEDDAQNGPDHVDAHRTIALAISPYTRRGTVDSTMYSTSSMLRTMELILGMRPMSQFDAAATPMYQAFQSKPNLRPFTAAPAGVDTNETNSKLAWGAKKSSRLNFSKEDSADDLVLNEIIWRSVRGPLSQMPSPVRAAFVFTSPFRKDDD
jgi:phospholipase C